MIQRCALERHFCQLFAADPQLYALDALLSGQCPGDSLQNFAFIRRLVIIECGVEFDHRQLIFVHRDTLHLCAFRQYALETFRNS
ncbi:hypothetical protein D3C80_2048150 [compost metagenome]